MKTQELDKKIENIVDEIVYDISDRFGIGNEWDVVDEETQEEIKQIWADIIKKGLK